MFIEKVIHDDMKIVYSLEKRLELDKDFIKDVQSLTLDLSKPRMGLSGKHGLFASSQWWLNITNGNIPVQYKTGIITKAYIAGENNGQYNDTIDILLDNGNTESVGIFVNNDADANLFKIGCRATIVYILDELKTQPAPNGEINYLKITFDMAVSK